MKVLHLINTLFIGGAEKLLVDLIPELSKRGIDITVLTLKYGDTPFKSILEKELKTNIGYLTKGTVYNPFLVFKLMKYLKQYDIIHVHLFPAFYLIVIAKVLSFSKTKIIYTEHNLINVRRKYSLLRIFDRFIYRRMSGVVTISEEVHQDLKKYLNPPTRYLHLIRNGVDISSFSEAIGYDKNKFFDEESFILIQVSRFEAQKDQPTLIRSLEYLPAQIKLILVGEGYLKVKCEELARELKITDRVLFLGRRSDVPSLLKTSDVAILSTFYEGLSLSCIEGMAVLPFIGSDVPGVKSLIEGYGLLFQQGDAKGLAKLVMNLYNDKQLYNDIKRKCHNQSEAFDLSKMIEGHVKLYKSV